MGPETRVFETSICNYTSAKYAVVRNNRTSASRTALFANRIGPGDKALVAMYIYSLLHSITFYIVY
jgi:dTDP-4-amino-4,6-dideoxygalactose transaminase